MKHLDDTELMAAMNGEAGAGHLQECSQCGARYQVLEQALGEFTTLHRGIVSKDAAVAARFTPGATPPMTQQLCVVLPRKSSAVAFARYSIKDPTANEVEGR